MTSQIKLWSRFLVEILTQSTRTFTSTLIQTFRKTFQMDLLKRTWLKFRNLLKIQSANYELHSSIVKVCAFSLFGKCINFTSLTGSLVRHEITLNILPCRLFICPHWSFCIHYSTVLPWYHW